jgi:hypothetical protein
LRPLLLFKHVRRRAEGNDGAVGQNNQCPSPDPTRVHPGNNSAALPLSQLDPRVCLMQLFYHFRGTVRQSRLAAGVEKTHFTFPSEGTKDYEKILGQKEYTDIYSYGVHFSKLFPLRICIYLLSSLLATINKHKVPRFFRRTHFLLYFTDRNRPWQLLTFVKYSPYWKLFHTEVVNHIYSMSCDEYMQDYPFL